jgi:hypothetical protein
MRGDGALYVREVSPDLDQCHRVLELVQMDQPLHLDRQNRQMIRRLGLQHHF